MAKGVEAESLSNGQFNILEQMNKFLEANGILLACGTCIEIRKKDSTELCPMSNMGDLYDIIKESDKLISF